MLQRRTLFDYIRKTSEKQFKIKDKIEENFLLIYKAPMRHYLVAVNHITTASALLFGAFVVQKLIEGEDLTKDPNERYLVQWDNGKGTMTDNEFTLFGLSMIAFFVSLRMILYKYPLRIYRKQTR